MICIIALIVFGILGIFSASYRVIAKEAADCVFRRLTLRKCESGLDKRLKNQISGKIARKRPKLAKFLHKYFEVFSWILLIILVWSLVNIGIGLYNFAQYGNCNGPANEGFCIFDPTGSHAQYSGIQINYPDVKITPVAGNDPSIGPENASVTFIVFGCYSCPYTKKGDPTIMKIVKDYKNRVKFVFKEFPLPKHAGSMEAALAAQCSFENNKYFEAREYLFENQERINEPGFYEELSNSLQLDTKSFIACMNGEEAKNAVLINVQEGVNAHVYGTPSAFIGDIVLVGPKEYNDYKNELERALNK